MLPQSIYLNLAGFVMAAVLLLRQWKLRTASAPGAVRAG
jgi:hypothetical protein